MGSYLGLDIGSNSVGSAWVDDKEGILATGTSIFPAGVDESDEKRGEPKNAKRRMTRRTRITLARRAARKRLLCQKLISEGLLPSDPEGFKKLLEQDDPWILRRKGLSDPLTPHQFGRVVLHLAQRRGAQGLKIAESDEATDAEGNKEDGKVKAAITAVRTAMRERNARTFGEFMALVRAERVTAITTEDKRTVMARKGAREYRNPIRNKAGSYEHCADRAMIRDEFARLWNAQKGLGTPLAEKLTDGLRRELDNETGDSDWKQKGLLFGQRRASWDLGTLGRCVLEPTERCAPHADMYASRFLVVETVNNLKVVERGKEARSLTPEEREKIKAYLSGPLGVVERGKFKDQPKRTVSVSDLRALMGWGPARKTSQFSFNIEADEDRLINTDWFSREIVQGAVTREKWEGMSASVRDNLNRAVLKFDPDEDEDAAKLRVWAIKWAALTERQADSLVAAWRGRPKPDSKRLNMSRRAARNLLQLMDRPEPWPDENRRGETRWLTPIEARKRIARDSDFRDVTTGQPLNDAARRRYATGAKGATARDRHYMKRHLLRKNGQPIFGPDGCPLGEPPPAPLISNPVVRKAIHEVRRHLIEFMIRFGRKPDQIHVELARDAKMGKKEADEVLFRNRLRNRIRNDIVNELRLDAYSSTQQREAVRRVVLAVQQKCVCALCGKPMAEGESEGITPRTAAEGRGCEVAHIIPRASGGTNGFGNTVLAHTPCNREMRRQTPRQYWESTLKTGFEEGISWIEKMYGGIERPMVSAVKEATSQALWSCYFTRRDDLAKIAQFKKDIKDIQGMTARQEAATKYAARQVMAYLADAVFDGKGLPERGGVRLIHATDGMWTSRLRREWGLFFDPHASKAKGLSSNEEHLRTEKNRGDHRHHAIDAVVIAHCTQDIKNAWDVRERRADIEGINTADEEAMDAYRRLHPLGPPAPFRTKDEFREAVKRSIFGEPDVMRPICHRPVKRKLIGALHEETLLGPVLDYAGKLTEGFTAKKSVLQLEPNHLRMPRQETKDEAIERLAARRRRREGVDEKTARKWARGVVSSKGYKPAVADPPPGKSGIVRDIALRRRIRECLSEHIFIKKDRLGEPTGESWAVNPDDFTDVEIKQAFEEGKLCQKSGVPIRSVVLLRTMNDPVIASRWTTDYSTGNRRRLYDATTGEGDARAARAYLGGNNHHIEIRVATDKKGAEIWSGKIVTAFEAARRKLDKLRALRNAKVPCACALRKLSKSERSQFSQIAREIELAHPLVDRTDSDDLGGRFIMSLCEGEMLLMKHKATGEVGYFVVAKLDKPQSIVLVPHWDARSATERKDAEGKKVVDSKREQFSVVPTDLKTLAVPGQPHAMKVRVSPLGECQVLSRD